MAYSAVPSVSTGDLWTAANHNTYLRDNLSDHESRIVAAEAAITALPDGIVSIPRRQGGSSDWYVGGHTNYDTTDILVQFGVALVSFSTATSSQETITFETPYTSRPAIFLSCPNTGGGGYVRQTVLATATTSDFVVQVDFESNFTGAINVPWLSFGPSA